MFDRQQTVASVVLEHSECAQVFQQRRIDFCCHGHVTVEEAASAKGIDVASLLAELSRVVAERRDEPLEDPRALATPALVEHIVSRHHDYLRRALPYVRALMEKVSRVHGDHNPKLRELEPLVDEIADALLVHLDMEEQQLFPALMAAAVDPVSARALLGSMVDDHHAVAALLERIREAGDDFTPPDWACNSYRTLFAELEDLEADVFRHVHLEHHVLEPRFVA